MNDLEKLEQDYITVSEIMEDLDVTIWQAHNLVRASGFPEKFSVFRRPVFRRVAYEEFKRLNPEIAHDITIRKGGRPRKKDKR